MARRFPRALGAVKRHVRRAWRRPRRAACRALRGAPPTAASPGEPPAPGRPRDRAAYECDLRFSRAGPNSPSVTSARRGGQPHGPRRPPARPRLASPPPPPPPRRRRRARPAPGDLLVTFTARAPAAADLAARAVGADVVYRGVRAPIAVLRVADPAAALPRLRALPGVRDARPEARVRAACDPGVPCGSANRPLPAGDWQAGFTPAGASLYGWQWYHHVDYAWLAWAASADRGASVAVAVLDTGVSPVSSLARLDLAAGANFIDPSAPPLDDNGHGTQMASLIAGSGSLWGVAPGARVVPVKVLDHDRVGSEAALIDGLLHAAATDGVAVVSMSLTFPPDYRPSPALADAVAEVDRAGITMVAAAGNDGVDQVGYPAHFPQVIAVGAARLARADDGALGVVTAEYSNRGHALDVVAPGGDLGRDEDQDGHPDGILVEGPPTAAAPSGLFLTAGTSPATAQVAGAVALLRDAGVPAADVRDHLQATAQRLAGAEESPDWGHGLVHVGAAMPGATAWYGGAPADRGAVFANAQVVFERVGPAERAVAVVEIADRDAAPCAACEVRLQFGGDVLGSAVAYTDAAGVVAVAAPDLPDGAEGLVAVTVDAVVLPGDWRPLRPDAATRIDRGSYELLATLGTGLVSSAIILDYGADAWAGSPYVDPARLVDSYVVRAFGPTHQAPTVVGLLPGYLAAHDLAKKAVILETQGTGLVSSALVFDQALFALARQRTWGQEPLFVMQPPVGSGLVSSAIIWDEQRLAAEDFVADGERALLVGAFGGALAGSAVVRNRALFSEALFVGSSAAGWSPDPDAPAGLAATLRLVDFGEAGVTELGGSWPALDALYGGAAAPPADAALMAGYSPLSVAPDRSGGVARPVPLRGGEQLAFAGTCAGPDGLGAVNACGGCGATPVETCDGRDDDCDGLVDEGLDCVPPAEPAPTEPTGWSTSSATLDARVDGGGGCAGGPAPDLALALLALALLALTISLARRPAPRP
ncbi:MAG: S8 family serine peptidase [Deltaproteobacteria bacterium]|nr:S8 family serine peptidase [Deltaproteobacteria bacterium]